MHSSAPFSCTLAQIGRCVISTWRGRGDAPFAEQLAEHSHAAHAAQGELLVIDVSQLDSPSAAVCDALAALILRSHRVGRTVTLSGCAEPLFDALYARGCRGVVSHAASLSAATRGAVRDETASLTLHLRGEPSSLRRFDRVLGALGGDPQVGPALGEEFLDAVRDAVDNAIRHGCPLGECNHVRVSFHVVGRDVVVDVADPGAGFAKSDARRGGGLSRMMAAVDRLDLLRDEGGMLVRLTRRLRPDEREPALSEAAA